MNQNNLRRIRLKLASLAAFSLLLTQIAGAQTYFTNSSFGDLIAGFRKTGAAVETNEMVVYLGNITNFIKLPVGTTIPITNYSATQINYMCPDNLENLQWSVFSYFERTGTLHPNPWVTPVGTFPWPTCWLTQARTSFNTPSTPPARLSSGDESTLGSPKIASVSSGAVEIGESDAPTNQFNNSLVVVEPTSFDTTSKPTYNFQVADSATPSVGDFGGYTGYNIENTTPAPFSSAVRSDLFQFVVSGSVDPLSGQSTGNAYYLGYFTLNTDGTMTFTRDTASVSNPQPQPPVLSISTSISSGGGGGGSQVTSVISFNTTNAANYTLYYTNAAGLTTPVSNWPSITTGITGNNTVQSVTNVSTDPTRFYSIGAQ